MTTVDSKCDVSVCMPTYNGARYLRSAIESALSQTHRGIELLVVDDDSTDDTLAIAQEFARRDPRVRIHRNAQRLGLAGNWNRCLDLAEGDWIKFLFQDDYLSPDCVARMLEAGTQSGATIVACDRSFVFEENVPDAFKQQFLGSAARNEMRERFPGGANLIDKTEFAAHAARYPESNCVGEPTAVMFRRSAVERFGYFNAELVQLLDWEYWMRLAVNTGLYHIPVELAAFRLHGGAATMSNMTRATYRASALDALIIQHELVYNPHYAPVRRAAKAASPPVDLARGLFDYYQFARSIAAEHANGGADGAVAAEWRSVRARYRRLKFLPLTYFPVRVWGKIRRRLRAARAD